MKFSYTYILLFFYLFVNGYGKMCGEEIVKNTGRISGGFGYPL